jgi:uncharacterized protein YacL
MSGVYNAGVVSNVIHLATAPVFLLTAVATLLTVMTNRLGRVIDRTRNLEIMLGSATGESIKSWRAELANQLQRSKILELAITLFTFSGLLVCVVIASLFLGDYLDFNISLTVALLFVIAMLLLIGGLLSFLREIYLATRIIRPGAGSSKRGTAIS